MSDINEQVLARLAELRQDFKDLRKELRDDLQRTRHDIRDEIGGRVAQLESRVSDLDEETGNTLNDHNERIRSLEKSKWTLAGAASAAAAGATAIGNKIVGGGG